MFGCLFGFYGKCWLVDIRNTILTSGPLISASLYNISNRLMLHSVITFISYRSKLATLVEGDQKAPFSVANTKRCRGER